MGEFVKWLLHDDQKEVFELAYAGTLNMVFLALVALLLWPMGKAVLAWHLAKGFYVFWIVIYATAVLLLIFQKIFRVDMDTHFDAYVISALIVSGVLLVGWSAYAALTVRSVVASAPTPLWLASILYFIGFLSSYVGYGATCAYYPGWLYRFVNLPLALVCFVLFSLWPAAGRALYGWFFDLF